MQKMLLAMLLAVFTVACGASRMPPNLSPPAAAAWNATQVVRALDVVRDIAIAAGQTNPPLIAEGDTRVVVQYHQSALQVIRETPNGWKPVVEQGLDQTLNRVSSTTRSLISPYVDLVKAILREVK